MLRTTRLPSRGGMGSRLKKKSERLMRMASEDGFGFEAVAENFADFSEAGFHFFTDGGSYFVVSSGVFHVHERPSLDSCSRCIGHCIKSQKVEGRMQK